MLSTDVATEFRGRSISYELLPFSFSEYARFHGIDCDGATTSHDKEQASLLKNACQHYLVQGGFPGVQQLSDNERVAALQSYAQFTVSRDVVERYGFFQRCLRSKSRSNLNRFERARFFHQQNRQSRQKRRLHTWSRENSRNARRIRRCAHAPSGVCFFRIPLKKLDSVDSSCTQRIQGCSAHFLPLQTMD